MKRVKKKNAFSLIELLAVILILGIIALIAIPSVTNLILNARKGSFEASTNNLVDGVKTTCTSSLIRGIFISGTYDIVDSRVNGLDINISGNLPKKGVINVDNSCKVSIYAEDGTGKFYAVKTFDADRVSVYIKGESSDELDEYGVEPITEAVANTCYTYEKNKTGVTITGYKFENENCTRNLIIPTRIGDDKVTTISEFAFTDKDGTIIENVLSFIDDEYGTYVTSNYLYDKNIDRSNLGKLSYSFIPKGVSITETKCYDNNNTVTIKEGIYNHTLNDGYKNCIFSYDGDEEITNTLDSIDFSHAAYLKKIPKGVAISKNIRIVSIGSFIEEIESSAFYDNMISELIIPDQLTKIGSGAFEANMIKSVDLNKVEILDSEAFRNNQIDSVSFGQNLTILESGVFEYNVMPKIIIPNNITGIKSNAFHNTQSNLVSIGTGVRSIGEAAFYNETPTITSVTINSGVEYIGRSAFRKLNTDKIVIPSSVKFIDDYALAESTVLFTISMHEGVEKLGSRLFYKNTKMNHFQMPSSVKEIGEYFCYGCSGLNETKIGTGLKTIPRYAYYGTALRNLKIPSNIEEVDEWAFRCRYRSMASLTIENGLKTIKDYAFTFNKLTTITIPDSVKTIGAQAFESGTSGEGTVTLIKIGSGVTSIARDAFRGAHDATITIKKVEGSVIHSPWGATNSTVTWTEAN